MTYSELTKISILSLNEYKDCNFTVIDFETTGLSPAESEIIEFAAVQIHGGEIRLNLSSLCCPHTYISRRITDITGITNEMTASYPPFEDFLQILLSFMENSIVAAHNAPFDLGFLLNYCKRAGIDFSPKVFCTLAASRMLYKHLPSRNLSAVAGHLGISQGTYHRALADASVTAKIVLHMLKSV